MSGIFTDSAPLSAGSDHVPVTAAEPEGPARGGIVLLHESRQFGESVLDLMRALAVEGWLVVAPHLFHRVPESVSGVFGDALFEDFDAAGAWLGRRGVQPDRVGVLGFDQAGTAALLVATTRPVGAAISVASPGIVEALTVDAPPLVDAVVSLQAPWLGLYGDDDPGTPPEHVERLREAASRALVATLVVSYPGLGHRADEPSTLLEPTEETLVDAQERIFDWFDSNLR
ncbi:carboxymethylenebutenolidase [Rhodococcus triatomae]|uniref:Carboxymethylenebutenolidase n=1 Tax=Rhodococcus triatomae TaxID=300028 RepID=A0A1G8I596_9NOCA|nr:dienelactone hydrolase family protein [Rhodococcus triatomae]QNG20958.1 carboxymethylenebutenolidase [Rhodococcus triatomae]QNG23127.1 carboxymethylenebutenolidase [Rhodococcus triatomae]SDI14002.1 carboxymethylenebutenolidase [Rhodococcus triatomae]